MPKGVEHGETRASSRCASSHDDAVMPKGVEHLFARSEEAPWMHDDAVMPKGVEHADNHSREGRAGPTTTR